MKKRIAKKMMDLYRHPSPQKVDVACKFWYRKANRYTDFGLRFKGDAKKFLKFSNLYIGGAIKRYNIELANKIDGIQCKLIEGEFFD